MRGNPTLHKQIAFILTVDPSRRLIEARLKDGGIVQLAVAESGAFFRWPKENEYWSIYRENYNWHLGEQFPQREDDFPIDDLDPGDIRLTSDTLYTETGKLIYHEGNLEIDDLLGDYATDAELAAHQNDTTNIHGIADTTQLATNAGVNAAVATHEADTTNVHGISDTSALATNAGVNAAVATHEADTTNIHGITDTTNLAYKNVNNNFSAGQTIAHSDGLTLSADGGKDTLSLSNSTVNVGLTIGGDTNLYRSGAGVLATDGWLHSGTNLTAGGIVSGGWGLTHPATLTGHATTPSLSLGSDVSLQRGGADVLLTTDNFVAAGGASTTLANRGVYVWSDYQFGMTLGYKNGQYNTTLHTRNAATEQIVFAKAGGGTTPPTQAQLTELARIESTGNFVATGAGFFKATGGGAAIQTTTGDNANWSAITFGRAAVEHWLLTPGAATAASWFSDSAAGDFHLHGALGSTTRIGPFQSPVSTTPLSVNATGIAMKRPLAMNTNKITGLEAGAANGEALRYEQVVGVYAPLASPALTGTPTSTTAAVDTNTTQIATTAYVIGQGYIKASAVDATYATDAELASHEADTTSIHGIADTSVLATTGANTFTAAQNLGGFKITNLAAGSTNGEALRYEQVVGVYAPLASPALTGTPTAPTAAVDTNTTQVATTAYVVGQGYAKTANLDATYATDAALASHEADTTSIHGIADTSVLATHSYVTSAVSTHEADSTSVHGIADTAQLATLTNLSTHEADTTSVHGIADTAQLATLSNLSTHEADTTSIHGIADTAQLATLTNLSNHESDTTSIHGIPDTSLLLDTADLGVTVQGYDSGLAALAAFNTNGLLTQTANNTYAGRTLTGTSNRTTITNGDGVSGNPTVDISSAYVGQNTITTLGTITTGTWNGTALGKSYVPSAIAYEDEANTFTSKQGFVGALTTTDVLAAKVTGDTVDRFALETDGRMDWGDGASAEDVSLYRSGPAALNIDGALGISNALLVSGTAATGALTVTGAISATTNFSISGTAVINAGTAGRYNTTAQFRATDGITTLVKSGTVSDADFATTPASGTIAIDTSGANGKIWVRVGAAWKSVTLA